MILIAMIPVLFSIPLIAELISISKEKKEVKRSKKALTNRLLEEQE